MELLVGNIIQANYFHELDGCLLIVSEVKSYGCLAYIKEPITNNLMYFKFNHNEFDIVGYTENIIK